MSGLIFKYYLLVYESTNVPSGLKKKTNKNKKAFYFPTFRSVDDDVT